MKEYRMNASGAAKTAVRMAAKETADSRPLVSVIMPVYNAERFLLESVMSVLGQTYANIELICIDDGSTDMSLKILNKIKSGYPENKMVIISQNNAGPAAARNRGLDAARGEYISFVDSDDYIEPNAYAVLVNTALKNKADIVVFGGIAFPAEFPTEQWILDKLLTPNKIYDKKDAGKTALFCENSSKPFMWQHFIKRELIEAAPRLRMNEEFKLGEDQIFIFSYFPRAHKVVYIKNKIYHYRVRGYGSIMNKYNNMKTKKFDIHMGIVRSVLMFWTENNISDVSGEMTSYFLEFLYNDFQNFSEYLKIKYAKKIVEIFEDCGYDMMFCREYAYDAASAIKEAVQKKSPDILEGLNAEEAAIDLIEEKIALTMESMAYKIGRMLTPKKRRLDENWLAGSENKRIF